MNQSDVALYLIQNEKPNTDQAMGDSFNTPEPLPVMDLSTAVEATNCVDEVANDSIQCHDNEIILDIATLSEPRAPFFKIYKFFKECKLPLPFKRRLVLTLHVIIAIDLVSDSESGMGLRPQLKISTLLTAHVERKGKAKPLLIDD